MILQPGFFTFLVCFILAMLVVCLARITVVITRLERRIDRLERPRQFHTVNLNKAVSRRSQRDSGDTQTV